ncbi:MAG: PilZ domain-containing protein [Nitrospirae bacterium]|nr:PilZ domain-containing protein [Nitrospirota bacterium]
MCANRPWPGNGVYHGITHNVSDGGVYLSAGFDPPPQAGTEVTLRVARTGDGADVPTLRALVVRADARGVALRFLGRVDDGAA